MSTLARMSDMKTELVIYNNIHGGGKFIFYYNACKSQPGTFVHLLQRHALWNSVTSSRRMNFCNNLTRYVILLQRNGV